MADNDIERIAEELAAKAWKNGDPWEQLHRDMKEAMKSAGCETCEVKSQIKGCLLKVFITTMVHDLDTIWGGSFDKLLADILEISPESAYDMYTYILEYFSNFAAFSGFIMGLQVATILQRFCEMEEKDVP